MVVTVVRASAAPRSSTFGVGEFDLDGGRDLAPDLVDGHPGGQAVEDVLQEWGAGDQLVELAALGDGECEVDELCGDTESRRLAGDPGCAPADASDPRIGSAAACWSSALAVRVYRARAATPACCSTLCPTTDRSTN
ncbi:hypothetical protein SMICM17S_13163 [Streptomyces microflavus]